MSTVALLPFALTPAQANAGDIIDYITSAGLKLYNSATAPLPLLFDCKSKNVAIFCEKVVDRAHESGWATGSGDIINIPDANGIS